MDYAEFTGIHGICVTAMRSYIAQVEKTIAMLAESRPEPLSFKQRFTLMSQQIAENDAHLTYLGARSILLKAAKMGYARLT
jgi:hypothetical protein